MQEGATSAQSTSGDVITESMITHCLHGSPRLQYKAQRPPASTNTSFARSRHAHQPAPETIPDTMAKITDMPLEILRQIISGLYSRDDGSGYYALCSAYLMALSLSSKVLYRAVIPFLYRRFGGIDNDIGVALFLRTVVARPDLAALTTDAYFLGLSCCAGYNRFVDNGNEFCDHEDVDDEDGPEIIYVRD